MNNNGRVAEPLPRHALKLALGESDEVRPIRIGRMSGAVLSIDQVAAKDAGLDRRESGCAEVFLTHQSVNRSCADSGQERALRIDPCIGVPDIDRGIDGVSCAQKYRTRSAHRDQFVRIDRHVAPLKGSGVFQEVSSHPMVFIFGGDVLDDLAPVAAV